MTSVTTKKAKSTHWLVNLDTGPGLHFMIQLDSGLDMSVAAVTETAVIAFAAAAFAAAATTSAA